MTGPVDVPSEWACCLKVFEEDGCVLHYRVQVADGVLLFHTCADHEVQVGIALTKLGMKDD